MIIKPATLHDLSAIEDLRRKDQEHVGFIPMPRYEAETRRGRETLLCAFEDKDMVGFLFWTRGFPIATIQQVVIRPDARREARASMLIRTAIAAMSRQGRLGATARCRDDMEAAHLWPALGWQVAGREASGRRGPLTRFYTQWAPSLFDLLPYTRGPGFLPGMRQGFRRK